MADGTRNMTVGSPAGHLIRFALPLLAGSFLQQLYNMVDSFVVGRYVGDAALAAVGVGFPVLFMFTSLFTGLANGGTVVIAQLYGAGELQRVRDTVDTIYTAFLLSVLPVTLAAVALVKPLLVVLRVDASVWQDAWLYLTVVCCGTHRHHRLQPQRRHSGRPWQQPLHAAVFVHRGHFEHHPGLCPGAVGRNGRAGRGPGHHLLPGGFLGVRHSSLSTAVIPRSPSVPFLCGLTGTSSGRSWAWAFPPGFRCPWWRWAPWSS